MLLSSFVTQVSVNLPLEKSIQVALEASGLTLPASLKNAHPKRQEKFMAGRYCALLALKKSGAGTDLEVLISEDGSPVWPSGWTGSITHTEGFASAAVGRKSSLISIGIDTELIMSSKTFANVSGRILNDKELNDLCPPGWSEVKWATMVFSAKESIYKCLRPLCGNFFGFEDAEIDLIDEKLGIFKFHLTRDIGGGFLQDWQGKGRFEHKDQWIHTAMELTPDLIRV